MQLPDQYLAKLIHVIWKKINLFFIRSIKYNKYINLNKILSQKIYTKLFKKTVRVINQYIFLCENFPTT